MNRSCSPWPWWRVTLTVLSAVGLALSGYLAWHDLAGGSTLGCGDGSGCEQVLNSRWSSVAGVLPVSGLAAGTYLAMLVAGFFLGPGTETSVRRLAWRSLLVLAGAAAGSAVWFITLQKWVVGDFCPYCMATHVTSLLLAALVIGRTVKHGGDDFGAGEARTSASRRGPGRLPSIGLVLAGVASAGILALCQAHFVPPSVYRGGEAQNELPVLDPRAVPLIGSSNAPYVVTLLFDYNCPHCQHLSLMLDETVRRYGGKLAFALCPSPLNSRCNPYVPVNLDEFKTSCDLAKIGLAVWRARREAYPAFEHWMFSYESGDRWQPRSVAAARAEAIVLVGQAKLDAALADPWIGQYLQTSVRIYGATVQSADSPRRANAIPKLIFGSRWVIPEPNDADDLVSILQNRLAVPRP